MPDNPARLLTESETADLLGIKPQTLSVWRCNKRYALTFVKVGRCIRYRREDISAFLASRTVGAVAVPA